MPSLQEIVYVHDVPTPGILVLSFLPWQLSSTGGHYNKFKGNINLNIGEQKSPVPQVKRKCIVLLMRHTPEERIDLKPRQLQCRTHILLLVNKAFALMSAI